MILLTLKFIFSFSNYIVVKLLSINVLEVPLGGLRGSLFNFNREYNYWDTKFKKPLLNGKNGVVM